MTFAQQIEEAADGERIVACVIGNFGGSTIFGDGSGSRAIPAAMSSDFRMDRFLGNPVRVL